MRRLREWIASRRALVARLRAEERRVRLRDEEIEGLRRQIGAYRDFVDSFAWQRRAAGAESMAYAESLRRRDGHVS